MKAYRFDTSHYITQGYITIHAASQKKAIEDFKRDYPHLTLHGDGGRLYRSPQ